MKEQNATPDYVVRTLGEAVGIVERLNYRKIRTQR
jgi:hypothetical protein